MFENNSYPVFKPSQVLNDVHLNSLRSYLDEQDRVTRCRLIGIGIVCGLEISVNNTRSEITITKGCGITSEGYYLEAEERQYTHYKRYTPPESYPVFYNKNAQGVITTPKILYEIYDNNINGSTVLNSPSNFLNDKVVLLFLDYSDKEYNNCYPDDCREKGTYREFEVRKLLISKSDLSDILLNYREDFSGNSSINSEQDIRDYLNSKYRLPFTGIKRISCMFHGLDGSSGASKPANYGEITKAYKDAGKELKTSLIQAIREAYKTFNPILSGSFDVNSAMTKLTSIFTDLESSGNKGREVFIQYYYDFIKDLIDGYHEFIDLAFDLITDCCHNEKEFPRHVMLGEAIPVQTCEPTIFRHFFIQPPIYDGKKQKIARISMLFRRILKMIHSFSIKPELISSSSSEFDDIAKKLSGEIKITPSDSSQNVLGQRAIPFYYDVAGGTGSLENFWDYDKTKKCKADTNLSYHAEKYATSNNVEYPLCFSIDRYPFLRIEGHIGQNIKNALVEIEQLKERRNLAFKVIPVHIGENPLVSVQKLCSHPELQIPYDTWRNKLLFLLTNIVKSSYKIETDIQHGFLVANEYKFAGNAFLSNAGKEYFYMATRDISKAAEFKSANYYMSGTATGAAKTVSMTEDKWRETKVAYEGLIRNLDNIRVEAAAPGTAAQPAQPSQPSTQNEQLVSGIASEMNTCIRNLIKDLRAADLEDFEYDVYISHYQECLYTCIRAIKSLSAKISGNVLQDFILLIALTVLCALHNFLSSLAIFPNIEISIIYENYLERSRNLKKSLNLLEFFKNHPGIEHLAGVFKGGTFVLAYDSGKGAIQSGTVVADFSLPYMCCDDCRDALKTDIELKPVALPKCGITRPDTSKKASVEYTDVRIQLVNNLFDPDDFSPQLDSAASRSPQFGTVTFLDMAYAPDPSKNTKILNYKVNPDLLNAYLSSHNNPRVVFDEFTYNIVDANNDVVSSGTVTIIIYAFNVGTQIQQAIVRGTVKDAATNEVIPGATIIVKGTTTGTITGVDGSYSLTLDPGTYELQAGVTGYTTITQSVELASGETKTLDFLIGSPAMNWGDIEVIVVEEVEGLPLPDVMVSIAGTEYYAVTDAEGKARFKIPPGTYDFIISNPGYDVSYRSFMVTEGNNSMSLELNKKVSIDVNYDELYRSMNVKPGTVRATRIADAYTSRMGIYSAVLEGIKKDSAISADSPVYEAAEKVKYFAEEPEINIVKLNNEYNSTRNKLIKSIEESTGKEQELLKKSLLSLTLGYLNRLSLEQPEKLSRTTQVTLTETAQLLESRAGIDLKNEIANLSAGARETLPSGFIANLNAVI